MKKLFLTLSVTTLILFSASIFAESTNSVRTSTELVLIGDTEKSMLEKLGSKRARHYVFEDGHVVCAVSEYKYRIDYEVYTILTCKGRVFKIDWERA